MAEIEPIVISPLTQVIIGALGIGGAAGFVFGWVCGYSKWADEQSECKCQSTD